MEDAHARPLLALFVVLHAVFLPQLGDGGFTEVNKVLERSSDIAVAMVTSLRALKAILGSSQSLAVSPQVQALNSLKTDKIRK